MYRGEMLGFFHQQLRQFQPQIQPPEPPLETEIFIQLQERLSRLQPVIEKDLVSPTQINSWIHEVEVLKNLVSALRDTQDEQNWIIHGDYRAQNLKFDSAGYSRNSGFGYRLFRTSSCMIWHTP